MNEAFKKMLAARVRNIQPREETKYNCPKCRDMLYTFNEQGAAIPCECKDKAESLEKLKKCGLEEAFKEKTFAAFKVTTKSQQIVKEQAINYCNSFKETNSSLILCGPPGTGKTHLATATMLDLINQNVSCKYELYTSMLINLKQSVMDSENFMNEMSKYKVPKVLFLDDFLKGKPTDADLKYIFEIVNERYLKKKPLIISSEMSIKQLMDWDEATTSRLVQMAQGNIIQTGNIKNQRIFNNFS